MAQKNNALATKGNQSAEHKKAPAHYIDLALRLAIAALLVFACVEG